MKNKESKDRGFIYLLLLFGIFAMHTRMNYEVLNKSEVCRIYDESNRLREGLRYYKDIFVYPNKFQKIDNDILRLSGQAHPPFVAVVEALVCKLLTIIKGGFDEASLILATNTLFLLILLASVYGIGSVLYDNKVGIMAALLVSFFPLVIAHSRIMLLDFPLSAMVALSFFLLFKTNKFQSLFYSILFGIVFGLSELTKESALIFVLFGMIYYFCDSYRSIRGKRVVRNFILALFCALIVAGAIYLRPENFLYAFKTYMGKTFFPYSDFKNRNPLFVYFENSVLLTGTYLAAAIIPVLICYALRFRSQNKTLFLWIVPAFAILVSSVNKQMRFLLPLVPALALITSQELFNGNLFSKVRRYCIVFLVFLILAQYGIYFYNARFLDPVFYGPHSIECASPGILTSQKDEYYSVVMRLLSFFKNERYLSAVPPRVTFLFNIGEIHSYLNYRFELEDVYFSIACPQEGDAVDAPEPGTVHWEEYVSGALYVVDISPFVKKDRGGGKEDVESQIRESFRRYRDNFKEVLDFEIFDGSRIHVYKNLNYSGDDPMAIMAEEKKAGV